MTTATAIDLQAIAAKLSAIPDFQRDERGLIDRETQTRGTILALVAKQHIILHGPPGNAKTMCVDGVMEHLPDLSKFKTQAYKASPPEQFLGMISFKGMAEDRFVRIVKNKIPGVEVAVVDEFPRAPRAVLPAMQGMMVEREFDSGDGVKKVPLTSLIGTSNKLLRDEELEAFFDRFVLKFIVLPPASQDQVVTIFEQRRELAHTGKSPIPDELIVSTDELHAIQESVDHVHVPREVYVKLAEIRANLIARGVDSASMRRYGLATDTIAAVARLDGRDEALIDDLQIVEHILWTHEEEQPIVHKEVVKYASEWIKAKAELIESYQEILDRLGQVQNFVSSGVNTTERVEINDAEGETIRTSDGSNPSITEHAIRIVNEQRTLRALVEKHKADAQGRDVSDLEAIESQMDGAQQWITERIMGGLSV